MNKPLSKEHEEALANINSRIPSKEPLCPEDALDRELKSVLEDLPKLEEYYGQMCGRHGKGSFAAGKALGRLRGLQNLEKLLRALIDEATIWNEEKGA